MNKSFFKKRDEAAIKFIRYLIGLESKEPGTKYWSTNEKGNGMFELPS